MVASQPARQRSARRNQRCFCYLARLAERRPRAGSATFFKPSGCASRLVLRRRKTAVRGSHLWRSPGPGEGPRQSLEKHQARWCRHSQLATRLRSRKRIGLASRRSSTKKRRMVTGWRARQSPTRPQRRRRSYARTRRLRRFQYKLLHTILSTSLQKDINKLAAVGFRVSPGTLLVLQAKPHGDHRESDAGVRIALPIHHQGNRAYLQRRERSGEGARAGVHINWRN